MKLFTRVLATVIAGIIAVLAVQNVIRRAYRRFGGKYLELPLGTTEKRDLNEE